MNKICQIHNVEMEYREGDSKTKFNDDGSAKHWKGWFCPESGKIEEWVNDKPNGYKKVYKKPVPLISDEQYQNLLTANRELYLLVKAVALAGGLTERDIQDMITKLKEKK